MLLVVVCEGRSHGPSAFERLAELPRGAVVE